MARKPRAKRPRRRRIGQLILAADTEIGPPDEAGIPHYIRGVWYTIGRRHQFRYMNLPKYAGAPWLLRRRTFWATDCTKTRWTKYWFPTLKSLLLHLFDHAIGVQEIYLPRTKFTLRQLITHLDHAEQQMLTAIEDLEKSIREHLKEFARHTYKEMKK